MKNSHEYAQELQQLAAELLARPAFPKSVVCRKIQDEVWECDPVFEADEVVADEAAA